MKESVQPSPIPPNVTGERYGDQWVAILRRRVVDHDASLRLLHERMRRKGIAEDVIFYNVPPPGVVFA